MELTLKRLLEQAKFTTTRKGYDQDEVDDFLDRAVAMATKVEARLTQALADAGQGGSTAAAPSAPVTPTRSDEEIEAEISAEVAKRVNARVAELEAAASKPPVVDHTATADEAARTLVLAQRTADAAVAEAKEEADQIKSRAAEDAEKERSEARGRLAAEIRKLEEARDGLHSDVSALEGHVEEQRVQMQSTIAELQRLLDDPAAFRLAPAPESKEVAVPDLEDVAPAAPAPSSDHHAEVKKPTSDAPSTAAAPSAAEPAGPSGSAGQGQSSPAPQSSSGAGRPEGTSDLETIDLTGAVESAEMKPGVTGSEAVDPEASLDAGPPTAPVSIVDLDLGPASDPVAVASQGTPPSAIRPSRETGGDDAFLAELRKAMADEEPLGPRDVEPESGPQGFLDDDRRGWRFGKRR